MKKKIGYVTIAISLIFLEMFFFRNIIFKGMYFGDYGDGKLTMLLAEHWWNVIQGIEGFNELPIFYPVAGVLGYSDMLMGFGLIHSLFRLVGMDMYHAYVVTLILIHIVGTFSLFVLLNHEMRLHWGWALLGTVAFSYSNNYAQILGHTQLMAFSCVPVLLLLLAKVIKNLRLEKIKIANVWMLCCILEMLFILYTSWYIAFFVGFYTILFGLIFLCRAVWYRQTKNWGLVKKIKEYGKYIIFWTIVVVVCLIPFIKVYLPVLQSTGGGYAWDETKTFLPEIADLFNVGDSNILEHILMQKMNLDTRGYSGELAIGYTIVFWIFIISMCLLHQRHIIQKGMGVRTLALSNIVITCFIGILLVLRLSTNGLSIWWCVVQVVPGAGSVRTICRWILFLTLPFSIYISLVGNELIELSKKRLRYTSIGMIFLCVIVYTSNLCGEGVYATVSVKEGIEDIFDVEDPPRDCNVFFIKDTSSEAEISLFTNCLAQMQAYEIANKYHIKTINGYSGQFPEGWGHWDKLYNIYGEDYENYVDEWCIRHGIDRIWSYDIGTNQWEQFQR